MYSKIPACPSLPQAGDIFFSPSSSERYATYFLASLGRLGVFWFGGFWRCHTTGKQPGWDGRAVATRLRYTLRHSLSLFTAHEQHEHTQSWPPHLSSGQSTSYSPTPGGFACLRTPGRARRRCSFWPSLVCISILACVILVVFGTAHSTKMRDNYRCLRWFALIISPTFRVLGYCILSFCSAMFLFSHFFFFFAAFGTEAVVHLAASMASWCPVRPRPFLVSTRRRASLLFM
jgi:hypothetical protein